MTITVTALCDPNNNFILVYPSRVIFYAFNPRLQIIFHFSLGKKNQFEMSTLSLMLLRRSGFPSGASLLGKPIYFPSRIMTH